MSVDAAAIRKAPVGRVATLSADLFNGPDPVPGIEVVLPLEQVKASTIGADVALVPPADLAALCDEVDALRAALAAKDAENERLRGALRGIRGPVEDALRHLSHPAKPPISHNTYAAVWDALRTALDDALRALADGEATG